MQKHYSSRYKICKKFIDDIWGHVITDNKSLRIFRLWFKPKESLLTMKRKKLKKYEKIIKKKRSFVLRMDLVKRNLRGKRPTNYGIALKMSQKIRHYFDDLNENDLRLLISQFRSLRQGSLSATMIHLECRIAPFIYRCNFVSTIKNARRVVERGYVAINSAITLDYKRCVNVLDKVSMLRVDIRSIVKRSYFKKRKFYMKAKRGSIFMFTFSHVEICYLSFTAIIARSPNFKEYYYPFKFSPNILQALYPC